MRKVLVCGGGGFLGNHLISRLKQEDCWVRAVDRKYPEFEKSKADIFDIRDLRYEGPDCLSFDHVTEVYQLAAEVGGAGYLFTGQNDCEVLHNSTQINLNVLEACRHQNIKKVFFASSACVYDNYDVSRHGGYEAVHMADGRFYSRDIIGCRESEAYPANPNSAYGWEKLYAERLYAAYGRRHGIDVRIARFHNVFGPFGTYKGGREKAPAAICRKVAEALHGERIKVWGDGQQTRSFTYVNDAIEGVIRLMKSDYNQPINIGSSKMITIDELVKMVAAISGKWIEIEHVDGPVGVYGRNSDNTLIKEKLRWEPVYPLELGLMQTYHWIADRLAKEQYAA